MVQCGGWNHLLTKSGYPRKYVWGRFQSTDLFNRVTLYAESDCPSLSLTLLPLKTPSPAKMDMQSQESRSPMTGVHDDSADPSARSQQYRPSTVESYLVRSMVEDFRLFSASALD